jgi:hypothetical protein
MITALVLEALRQRQHVGHRWEQEGLVVEAAGHLQVPVAQKQHVHRIAKKVRIAALITPSLFRFGT